MKVLSDRASEWLIDAEMGTTDDFLGIYIATLILPTINDYRRMIAIFQ